MKPAFSLAVLSTLATSLAAVAVGLAGTAEPEATQTLRVMSDSRAAAQSLTFNGQRTDSADLAESRKASETSKADVALPRPNKVTGRIVRGDAETSWTNTSGTTIQARFVRGADDAVVIRKDGKEFTVPLAELTPESQQQARNPSRASAPLDDLVIRRPPSDIKPAWKLYEPVKYLNIAPWDIHVLGTATVSEWMMRESCLLVSNMVGALKNPEDRARFSGHQVFLITDDDPPLPGTKGQRNGGGKTATLFNESMVCTEAVNPLLPDAKPVYRGWNTPVHEFGHSIEFRLELQSRSDAVFSGHAKNYDPKVAREYFAWAVQAWFACSPNTRGRDAMPDWQFEYLSTIFSAENRWTPDNTPRAKRR